MFTALWWVFSYRCITYQHLATIFGLFWAYTRNENHQNVSSFRKFSFFVLGTPHLQSALVFMQQYHYFTTQAPCSLPYLKSLMRNPAKNNRWSPLGSGHENGGIHWVFFFIPLFSFLLTQVLSSPTDTVLMLVTYHRNFCSHHGHHLCRGKIGDMMAFPLSQLRAQSSPTSPSVCTPARVCDYGENVSHEECVSLWH